MLDKNLETLVIYIASLEVLLKIVNKTIYFFNILQVGKNNFVLHQTVKLVVL